MRTLLTVPCPAGSPKTISESCPSATRSASIDSVGNISVPFDQSNGRRRTVATVSGSSWMLPRPMAAASRLGREETTPGITGKAATGFAPTTTIPALARSGGSRPPVAMLKPRTEGD